MADNHINYIVNRTRFFLDLDLLQLDEAGMWPYLREEEYQPEPRTEFPPNAGRPYGDIPSFLLISDEIERMLYAK